MTITHQTVVDSQGKPAAALIPWSEFLLIQEILDGSDVTAEEAALSARPKLTVGQATGMPSPILHH
jgi:hypothetical protein